MKFINVEIEVYDKDLHELGIDNEKSTKWAKGAINKDEVTAVSGTPFEPEKSYLYLKGGGDLVIRMHIDKALILFTN
jgi:hypothetical protein